MRAIPARRKLVAQLTAAPKGRPINGHFGTVQSYDATTNRATVALDGASATVTMKVKAGYNNGVLPTVGDNVTVHRVGSTYLLDDKIP